MKHAAVKCLEDAIKGLDEEIKAARKELSSRRAAVALTEGHLADFNRDRDNINLALEMVQKRVAA